MCVFEQNDLKSVLQLIEKVNAIKIGEWSLLYRWLLSMLDIFCSMFVA